MWYRFEAWNQEWHYGWTRDPDVAEAVSDSLSKGREANLYSAVALSDSDDEADTERRGDDAKPLRLINGLVCDDDTHTSDFDA